MAELHKHTYQLASRAHQQEDTLIAVGDQLIGGDHFTLIAGPCAVEHEKQMHQIASMLHLHGVRFLRGGAYKPRTSPYRFQGMGLDGLKLMRDVANTYQMYVVTELMDFSLLDEVYAHADIIQVGARNMKNYHLLKQLGGIDKPVLLKRGMDATIEEWLLAAEYILLGGNEKVILCERGIRTFDTSVRNTFDIAAIPLVKSLSHLPVIADPSQGTGNRNLVTATSLAAVAAGANGLMIEVHNDPEMALSDGPQSLYPEQFNAMMGQLRAQVKLSGKIIPDRQKLRNASQEKLTIS
jgi:3-deoxy-7-phosphoheptulonate synthase